MHTMYLNDNWFEYVKAGEKIYEGKLLTENMKKLKIYDTIRFINYDHPDSVKPCFRIISRIYIYPTFKEALQELDISNILPTHGLSLNLEEACKIYNKIISYDKQLTNNVIMFKLTAY
jgi:ASC-1-like (ASCH) protein